MRALSLIRSAAALRSAPAAGDTASFTAVRPTAAHSEALTVLAAATELEPDLAEAVAWYLLAPIAELDYLTAGELVARGRAQAVLGFLRAVIDGKRD